MKSFFPISHKNEQPSPPPQWIMELGKTMKRLYGKSYTSKQELIREARIQIEQNDLKIQNKKNTNKWLEYLQNAMNGEASPLVFLNRLASNADPVGSEIRKETFNCFKQQIKALRKQEQAIMKASARRTSAPQEKDLEKILTEQYQTLHGILLPDQNYNILLRALSENLLDMKIPRQKTIHDCIQKSGASPDFLQEIYIKYPFL